MTYKEALRIVCRLSVAEASRLCDVTTDAGLRTVCRWRVEEPVALVEILEAAGMADLMPEIRAAQRKWGGKIPFAERVEEHFQDWNNVRTVARLCDMTDEQCKTALQIGASRRGWRVERRKSGMGRHSYEYRIHYPSREESHA